MHAQRIFWSMASSLFVFNTKILEFYASFKCFVMRIYWFLLLFFFSFVLSLANVRNLLFIVLANHWKANYSFKQFEYFSPRQTQFKTCYLMQHVHSSTNFHFKPKSDEWEMFENISWIMQNRPDCGCLFSDYLYVWFVIYALYIVGIQTDGRCV